MIFRLDCFPGCKPMTELLVIACPGCFHAYVPKDGWRSLLQCHGNLEDESVMETEP